MFFSFSVSPIKTYALNLYVEKPSREVSVGDTVLLKIYVDTKDSEINVVEGAVRVSNNVTIKSVNIGGSVFSLWLVYPTIKGNTISFTGGTPSSVFGNRIHVFNVEVIPKEEGQIVFETTSLSGNLADGSGSQVRGELIKSSPIKINEDNGVHVNDLEELLKDDKSAPESFKIEYGRDQTAYDGKAFLSFFSTDDLSGVSKYEIKEGDLPVVSQTEGVYVLSNQNFEGRVVVTAIDNAGNRRSEEIDFGKGVSSPFIYIVGFLIFVVLVFLWTFFLRKKNEKN